MNLDAPSLRRRARELESRAETEPRSGFLRIAAAEAHLRLAVVGAEPREAAAAKALELDPYRADAHLVLAVERLRAGALGEALALLDDALRLAPGNSRVRLHRAYALLSLARARGGAPDHAAAARLEFEALAATGGDRVVASLGALEAAILGGETELETLFARVPREARAVRSVARLLCVAVVGASAEGARRCGAIATAWLGAFPGDAALRGAIAAARAKLDSPEEIVARVSTYRDEIADVAVVELLLRERLATVEDPRQRLALFDRAATALPSSDASSLYRLAVLDEIASAALARGEHDGARDAWERCLVADSDHLPATEGLLGLVERGGDVSRAEELRSRVLELWAIYAEHGPDPGAIFARASARIASQVERELGAPDARSLAAVEELTRRVAVSLAVGRLGADEDLRRATPAEHRRALLAGDAASFDIAVAVLEVSSQAPLAPAELVVRVARAGTSTAGDDAADRIRLAGMIWRLRGAIAIDTASLTRACAELAYGGVVEAARAEYRSGRPGSAKDLVARYVDAGASLPELQYTYVIALLEDPRIELASAVELARARAATAVGRLRQEDPPFIAARLRRIAEAPFVEIAEDAATERAANLLHGARDSKSALEILFAAYPGRRPAVPALRFASEVWGEMPPAGRGAYASVVAQAIRSNVIRWYNATQARADPWSNAPNRATAAHMLTLCEHWAAYAKGALASDPLDDETKRRHTEALDQLLAVLQADRLAVFR